MTMPKTIKNNTTADKTNLELCPVAKKCGGCQLQNMDYLRQLRFKQAKVEKLLGRNHKVRSILGMDVPYHYRNKVQAAFAPFRGSITTGIYQSATRRVVPVRSCMTEDKICGKIVQTAGRIARDLGLSAVDPRTGRGLLCHILVRRGFATGQILVAIVTSAPAFPRKNDFVSRLVDAHPNITTVVHNISDGVPMVLGNRENVLYGPGYIEDKLCGLSFRVSARSFYQINPQQTEKLYDEAIAMAQLTGNEAVIDAYCGIGTIGLVAAARGAAHVVGVELNRDAVRDAIQNAKANKLQNARFFQGDAGRFMAELAEEGQSVDVVFMDPPRQGSDRAFLISLVRLTPKRVVYISCNPETQARDVEFLVKNGYAVSSILPVDMFPHTNHVECVCLLEKK
ncbi:MAG: 23S rRNA (uracil(1939)-C(5))-methyltransferase RlmD [Angelakisella sp.]|nr:23S rRNA (uracil(1939)-C(5))-methyltransferase RlmD [Angelakisella sp.]